MYGGNYSMFSQDWRKFGIETSFSNTLEAQDIVDQMQDKTKLVWVEVVQGVI